MVLARRNKKLPDEVKRLAEKRVLIFLKNWKSPELSVHKLKGKLAGLWAFSIDNRFRIIFEFADKDTVIFHTIGDHSIYD